MFFYELREGDDEVFSQLLVVSDSEWEPQEFFDLVQRIRHDVQNQYVEDTLIEAIAVVLERDHGFVFAENQLTASVNVSTQDADNFLDELEGDDADDDDERDDDEPRGDYRSILADLDLGSGNRPN
ncbi:MAG TPA: hypothetical protein VFI69_07890 [Candidatus Limnocylindrales bacterium]|nr:hypothetical protein [Candidatus Limnocylindrales bacterium]